MPDGALAVKLYLFVLILLLQSLLNFPGQYNDLSQDVDSVLDDTVVIAPAGDVSNPLLEASSTPLQMKFGK